MKPIFIDLSGEAGLGLRSMEIALATAKATEKRAALLLVLARSSPDLLAKAQGIYVRAGARARNIQARLDQLVGKSEEAKS